MKYISFLFFRLMVFVFRLLPFKLLYMLSDIVAFIFHKILRYRYKVIKENLNYVNVDFKKSQEVIIRETYRNLADITVESIKGLSMSNKAIKARHKWINPEILNDIYHKNQSVILVTGHFNNWEWGAFSPNFFLKHKVVGLYKPLTNQHINNYMLRKRATSGTILADINRTKYYFENYHDKKAIFLMAADQSPTKPDLAIWTEFLGINTPCLHGIEKYKKEYNLLVVFLDIQRVKRGYYELELHWIDEKNTIEEYGKTTKLFMQELEKLIINNPESWLWTHRRWKHVNKKNL